MFIPTVTPPLMKPLTPSFEARWYTWSPVTRRLLSRWIGRANKQPRPRIKRLGLTTEYDYTFSIDVDSLQRGKQLQLALAVARELYERPVPDHVMLFTNLLGDGIDGNSIRFLFAFLREAIVRFSGNPHDAFYSPLRDVGKQSGDFPLHADLYHPVLLLNVFDQVPSDGSGATVLLSRQSLQEALGCVPQMPTKTKRRVIDLLDGRFREDGFDEFYNLLHGEEHPWVCALSHEMTSRQIRIQLGTGQGYLIDDRHWLHGREKPTGGVMPRRLHRLVFNPVDRRSLVAENAESI
jgi:hypothetical protein